MCLHVPFAWCSPCVAEDFDRGDTVAKLPCATAVDCVTML